MRAARPPQQASVCASAVELKLLIHLIWWFEPGLTAMIKRVFDDTLDRETAEATALREQYQREDNFVIYNYKEPQLGRGAFGPIFKALNKINGDVVALHQFCGNVPDAKDQQVLRAYGRLSHRNLLRCKGHFIQGGDSGFGGCTLNVAFELAGAGDLSRMIKHFKKQKRLIPERTIWKYFVQICAAVEYMHDHRVLHNEIEPKNVHITCDGVVKLCGVVDHVVKWGSMREGRRQRGSLTRHLSPERIHGYDGDFHCKSDVWQLGCLLYEMAALQSPFCGGDQMSIHMLCNRIKQCDYPPLPADAYSAELRALVQHCIVAAPDRRPDARYVHTVAASMHERYTTAAAAQAGGAGGAGK